VACYEINLPKAIAQRRLMGGTVLEEVMELARISKGEPFKRVAYFISLRFGR
jgi:hypothetical protein